MRPTTCLTIGIAFCLSTTALAQDLVGLGWMGSIRRIDSLTGAATQTGTGLFGQNASALDNQGRIWSTTRTPNTPYVYGFTVVDPIANTATQMWPGIDLRGMASTGSTMLWAVSDGATDTLNMLDTTTGTVTPIGSTGRGSIQGLATHQGVLYAWDLSAGLMTVNTSTGMATDVSTTVGGSVGSGSVQFLCSHSDGRLLAGGTSLYSVDVTTGIATLIGLMTTSGDIRGVEQVGGSISPFGQGCNGPSGPIVLTVNGTPAPTNQILTSTSTQHGPGILGVLIFGYSNTASGATPLPFNVDPLLGTNGCALRVRPDVTLIGVTSPAGSLVYGLFLPPIAANLTFHLQHAAFDPVPGNMSWSNGVTVRVGP